MAIKILLNSLYGAMGNKWFRYFDMRIAEGITLSGQTTIKWAEKHLNEFLNKTMETNGTDYVIAIDTDSVYVNMGPLVHKLKPDNPVDFLDKVCGTTLEGVLINAYDDLSSRDINDGGAFKITCRDERGIVVTIISDNYFGYTKKEIKTQISYSANLFGLVEEEHSGGAMAFSRYVFGDKVNGIEFSSKFGNNFNFEDVKLLLGDRIDVKPAYYAVDKKYPDIVYIPEFAFINTAKNSITWTHNNKEQKLILSPHKTYVHPTGNKFRLERHGAISMWRIITTVAEGVFCHKPSTVSGGGKSEISKSMKNAITYSAFNIVDIDEDFKKADEIIEYNYSTRWRTSRISIHRKKCTATSI
jgi:hypothetical protein